MTPEERRAKLAALSPEVQTTFRALPECGCALDLWRVAQITGSPPATVRAHLGYLAYLGLVTAPEWGRVDARERLEA
jgi:DNA-binding transcriptional ArsR family regulator